MHQSCLESKEKTLSIEKTDLVFNFLTKANRFSYYEGESFNRSRQLTFFKKTNKVPKATNLNNYKSTFVSPIHTFSMAGNIIVHTPI